MNEDAQSALLKTLEEPPAGVTIVLCADQEARLLPTVRSRCFRLRLGLVGSRDIEAILADHGLVDPPTAARLGRLAGGRPGLAHGLRPRPGGGPHPRRAHARPARPDRRRRRPAPGGGPGRRPARDRAGRLRWRRPARRIGRQRRPRARSGAAPRRGGHGRRARRAGTRRPDGRRDRRRHRHDGPGCGPRRGDPHARHGTSPGRGGAAGPVDRRRARPRPDRSRRRPLGPRHGPPRRAGRRRRRRSTPTPPSRSSSVPPGPPNGWPRTSHPSSSSTRWCWPGRVARPWRPERRPVARAGRSASMPTVIGRVQGVGFRYFALREGMDLGLDGWVANTRRRLGPVRRGGPAGAAGDPARAPAGRSGRRRSWSASARPGCRPPARSDRSRCAAAPTAATDRSPYRPPHDRTGGLFRSVAGRGHPDA